MVADWRSSGLSADAFARARGFGPHRLRYWSSRASEGRSQLPKFVELRSDPIDDRGCDAGSVLELRIAEYLVLRIPMSADRGVIADVLRAVLEVAL
jgi:hypothetical protein